jgi:hypothetical protein
VAVVFFLLLSHGKSLFMANNKRSVEANLYVKNFGKDIDESKLCQLFSIYGTITSCKVTNLIIEFQC